MLDSLGYARSLGLGFVWNAQIDLCFKCKWNGLTVTVVQFISFNVWMCIFFWLAIKHHIVWCLLPANISRSYIFTFEDSVRYTYNMRENGKHTVFESNRYKHTCTRMYVVCWVLNGRCVIRYTWWFKIFHQTSGACS